MQNRFGCSCIIGQIAVPLATVINDRVVILSQASIQPRSRFERLGLDVVPVALHPIQHGLHRGKKLEGQSRVLAAAAQFRDDLALPIDAAFRSGDMPVREIEVALSSVVFHPGMLTTE